MKYPLNRWQWFFRGMTCFLFGHKWKYARLRHSQYFGCDIEEVPYLYRKTTGNYMWETVSWWRAKCTRCREQTTQEPSTVWHKTIRNALSQMPQQITWYTNYVFSAEEL